MPKTLKISTVKGRLSLPAKELRKALTFVKNYHENIVEKWAVFFIKNKKVACEVINKEIK